MSVIGAPLTRVDGRMKVSGAAKYSAEFDIPRLAYAVLVQSTIPAGTIDRMDTAEAERASGVITILKPRMPQDFPSRKTASRCCKTTQCTITTSPLPWWWRKVFLRRNMPPL
jgi:xanthine dehydrogenase YagR molybdenum-binding subunit